MLPTGEVRHLAVRGEVEHDAEGRPVRVWGSAQDVTERHRVQEELRRTALTDPLTGLGNRLLLVDRLRKWIAALDGASRPRHVAVIAVDLDGLKRVNDTYGHATGDDLLRETARRLRSVVRDRDLVARLGGDEFVLLCAGVDVAGAARLAERIVAEISSPYLLAGGVTAWSGASVGVTVTDDPRDDVDRLLAQADRALYAAKGDGGNRYVVHPRAAGLVPPGPEPLPRRRRRLTPAPSARAVPTCGPAAGSVTGSLPDPALPLRRGGEPGRGCTRAWSAGAGRYGVTPKPARKARSSAWSIRYSSSTPVQLGLMPNEVTVDDDVGPVVERRSAGVAEAGPALVHRPVVVGEPRHGAVRQADRPFRVTSCTVPVNRVSPPKSAFGRTLFSP